MVDALVSLKEFIDRKPFFPPELQPIAEGNFIQFAQAPDVIEIQETQLLPFLQKFRSQVEKAAIGEIKTSIGDFAKRDELSREYGTVVKRKFSLIRQNPEYEAKEFVIGEHRAFTPNRNKSLIDQVGNITAPLELHSHPSPNSFSGEDYQRILVNLGTDKRLQLSKTPVIQLISTDDGYFLIFPTQETLPAIEPFIDNPHGSDLFLSMRSDDKGAADRIIEKSLAHFMSNYDFEDYSETTSAAASQDGTLSILLLNIQRSEVFKMPFYFMSKDGSVFKRIRKPEDYFPQLERRV